jgi:hypothetical protein
VGSVLVVDRSSFGDVGEERVGLNGYYSYYVVNAGDCVGFVVGGDDGECYRHCRCCPRGRSWRRIVLVFFMMLVWRQDMKEWILWWARAASWLSVPGSIILHSLAKMYRIPSVIIILVLDKDVLENGSET